MERKTAICPSCNEQIKVNPVEDAAVCKLCGKPFITRTAIELYKESQKPSMELLIEKFTALIKQNNVRAANEYLKTEIYKNYPNRKETKFLQEVVELSFSYVRGVHPYYPDIHLNEIEAQLKELNSSAPRTEKRCREALCARVNNLLADELNQTFSGEYAFLKMSLGSIKTKLESVKEEINKAESCRKEYDSRGEKIYVDSAVTRWIDLYNKIKKYEHLRGMECDDEYVLYTIGAAKAANCSYTINEFLNKHYTNCPLRRFEDLIKYLESFLSPNAKQQLATQRVEAESKRQEAERAKKEKAFEKAYNSELEFWNNYIDLLNAGKGKKALTLLETKKTRKSACKAEIALFKKGLLGVKYTGDVVALNAEKLAQLSVEHLKPTGSTPPTTTVPQQK